MTPFCSSLASPAGRLYAAKARQTSDVNGGTFGLSWIYLGKANNDELKEAADTTVFSDIFETASPTAGECPTGFRSVNAGGRAQECLKLKPGMSVHAAFLETRRYAGYKGATTEFSK